MSGQEIDELLVFFCSPGALLQSDLIAAGLSSHSQLQTRKYKKQEIFVRSFVPAVLMAETDDGPEKFTVGLLAVLMEETDDAPEKFTVGL
jgi:hypothetical protein